MSYSETDLATETLKAPGLVDIEGTLTAAEFEDARQSNRSVVATLAVIGLPIWNGSEMSVPEEYFIELALRCSLPIQFKNGLITHAQMLQMIDASEARLTVMAAPRGSMPMTASTNESTRNRSYYNGLVG